MDNINPTTKNEERVKKWREDEEEDLAKILAPKYNLLYLDLSRTTIELDALKLIPEDEAREANMAIFQSVGKKLQIAVKSPNPDKTKKVIDDLKNKGYKITVYMVSSKSLERAWSRYSEVSDFEEMKIGIAEISNEKVKKLSEDIKDIETLKKSLLNIIGNKKSYHISEIFEIILAGSIKSNASDIHIEPEEKDVRLRFRLDGILHSILTFDTKVYKLLLSRIKLVSGLKLNIRDRAQDGRFSIHITGLETEVRTSTIPGNYGESVVLRILNPEIASVKLEDLGIDPHLLEKIQIEIKKPNGMIVTTGPTGSGKSTTLYSFLKKIKTPNIKIITIENPIEYHISGVTQTQTNKEKGYDFSSGLKSILRQDPDVIMVGEIRDLDTAKTALNAALTGHMVLSTLHTNNAYGTIPRLIDLGVKPSTIAPALNMAIAQRLVRKLCPLCKKEATPNTQEKNKIERVLNSMPKRISKPDITSIKIFKPVGCNKCNNTGYKKRVGIYEAFIVNDKIEKLILENPTEASIREETKDQEFINITQDGILKVLKGVTSLKELERVVEV